VANLCLMTCGSWFVRQHRAHSGHPAFSSIGSPFSFHAGKPARCIGDRNGMLSLVLWSRKPDAGLPTVGRQRASNAGRRPAVDNPSAQPAKSQSDQVRCSTLRVPKGTFRSAFNDTDCTWQMAASESGTCTRGLRISVPERSTFAALASSLRVLLALDNEYSGFAVRPARYIAFAERKQAHPRSSIYH